MGLGKARRVVLGQPDPFDLLLKETEGAARPRPPPIIGWLANIGLAENLDNARTIDTGIAQGQMDLHVSVGGLIAFAARLSVFVGHGVGGSIISRRDIVSGEYGNTGDIGRLFPELDKPRPSGIDLVRDINAAGGELKSLFDVRQCLDTYAEVIDAWVERASDQLLIGYLLTSTSCKFYHISSIPRAWQSAISSGEMQTHRPST